MLATEQKVGLFVVATLVLFGIGTFLVGDVRFFGDGDRIPYKARIADVKGLREKASVRMAGVAVGEVGDIRLAGGEAVVGLRIKDDVRLPESTVASVGGTGLVGEKYITLSYDPGAEGRLEPGSTIPEGEKAQDMDDVMRKFGQVGEDVREVTATLREVLGGKEGQAKLERIFDNVDRLSSDLKGMAAQNREGLRKVVANLETITSSLKQDLPPMVANFRETAKGANEAIAANRDQLDQLVAKLSRTADNLAEITGNIREGKGTIGRLYKEEQVYDNLAGISDNLNRITGRIQNGEGALGKLVSDDEVGRDLEKAVSGVGEAAGRLQRMQTAVSMNTRYLTQQEAAKSGLSIRLQTRPTRYYLLGATSDGLATKAADAQPGDDFFDEKDEFGNELKFTFMFGRSWPNYGVSGRIGLKQSTGGLGMTYHPFRSLELSADLWDFGGGNGGADFDGPQSRFLARYSFMDDHLYVQGGVHNTFSDEYRSPFVGAGLRFFDEDLKFLMGSVPTGGL
ncbi:MlaD family protein [Thiohalorhabdus sp.]|uniref:MlaD family protein n=1 Tax=Thiohalorhabdus sp. TaxID=3094134 RepID=UPI002FC29F72